MLFGLAVLLAGTAALAGGSAIEVPRGTEIVIDGVLDDAEWRGSGLQQVPGGVTLRLRHDGKDLYLGITAERPGFASVCVARGETIDVLHASAALGRVHYTRAGRDWATEDSEFVYGLRRVDHTEEARAERRAYLEEHGWVASTYRMGEGKAQELRLSSARTTGMTGLAVAFFVPEGNAGSVIKWPATLADGDGCAHEQLVRGYVPPRLPFDPSKWATLIFAR